MADEVDNKLCVNTSLTDAYKCMWHYKWNHLVIALIAFAPFTILGLIGVFDPFFQPRSSHEIVPDGYNLSFFLYISSTYLWAIPCVILWHRLYLLGPEHLMKKKIWPILTRSFVMMTKLLYIIGIGAIVIIISMIILTYLVDYLSLDQSISNFIELTDSEFTRYATIISLAALFTYIVFLRFSLAICARTIGKKIGLRTSWRLTEKNTFRMFLSFVVTFLPVLVFSYAITVLYQQLMDIDLFYSGELRDPISYVHIFILAPIITLPLSAICSQCASYYRLCGGEDCGQDT